MTPKSRARFFSAQDRDNLRWFRARYLKGKTPWLLLVLGMILVQGVIFQLFLSITEDGLRVIFESGKARDLGMVCAAVFGLFSLRAVLSYLVPRITVRISNDAIYEMRRDLIAHLMTLDLAYFERIKSAEITQKLVTQTQQIGVFIGTSLTNAVRDAVTVMFVAGYLIYKNPALFLTALMILPFIIRMMNFVASRVKLAQSAAENALGDYMNGIEETVNGMRTVKISGQEEMEQQRLLASTGAIRDMMKRVQVTQALVTPSFDLSSAFIYMLVIGGGGYMALSPGFDMDGAGIITFLLGMVLILDPARLLALFFAGMQANLVLLDRVRQLFHAQASIVDAADAVTEFDRAGDIELRDVSFAYGDGQPLFDGLDMIFRGEQVSAIVGATGSGKTTILSLLSRLYDVSGGGITIGGQAIDKLKVASLRRSFSVVAQDIVIFNNSIWENIRYVDPSASDDEVWRAAENAGIADLIRARGEAPVGPKGAQLSGGQKQRIAIARAFLRDAPILLLDEATSALDQASEERIKAAIERLCKGRTTLIVAHRLSAVSSADRIFVLEAGRLVEQGNHRALLKEKGLYARLFQSQKTGYDGK
jgi:ATP-binding cassette subfamily B protein/subfamily B ATP-binding cassette protein MsbA